MSNNTNKNHSDKINQGLVYALIILVTFIVTICFFKLIEFGTSDTQFTAKFEFGATISSIILSVVAIVYTLIQSKQSDVVNTKVIDASEKIQDNSKILDSSLQEIKEQVDTLKKLDIENLLKSNMDSFEVKLNQLQQIFNGGFNDIRNSINSINNFSMIDRKLDRNDIEHLNYIVESLLKEAAIVPPLKLYTYILFRYYLEFEGVTNINSFKFFKDVLPSKIEAKDMVHLIDNDVLYYMSFAFIILGFISNGVGPESFTLNIDRIFLNKKVTSYRNSIPEDLENIYKEIDKKIMIYKY